MDLCADKISLRKSDVGGSNPLKMHFCLIKMRVVKKLYYIRGGCRASFLHPLLIRVQHLAPRLIASLFAPPSGAGIMQQQQTGTGRCGKSRVALRLLQWSMGVLSASSSAHRYLCPRPYTKLAEVDREGLYSVLNVGSEIWIPVSSSLSGSARGCSAGSFSFGSSSDRVISSDKLLEQFLA